MIKGNESDVAHIDFELQAKTDDIYSYVYIVLKYKELLISLETRCRIVMGYGSKCRIWYVQVDYIENPKLNIADKWLISLDHVAYVYQASSPWSFTKHTAFIKQAYHC